LHKFKSYLTILFLYFIIFVIVFAVSAMALTRRINRYKENFRNAIFTVEKETVVLVSPVEGQIEKISAFVGQRVKKDDILVILSNDYYSSRLKLLESLAKENISARMEAENLRFKESGYIIRAPKDGVVKEVALAAGSYVPAKTKLIVLYSDEDARLTTVIKMQNLEQIQKIKRLEVFSERLEQNFFIEFVGISESNDEMGGYRANFKFLNQNDSVYFVNGENVEFVPEYDGYALRPAEALVNIWNGLIIQK